MNRTYFPKFLFLIALINLVCSSPISQNLWTEEFLGTPHDIKFLNDKEYIVSTSRGTIAKLNTSGRIEWKKNMIYPTQFEIANSGQYTLLVNQQSNYLDLINNSNSQLIWSINFSKEEEGDFIRWDLLTEGKHFLGVLETSKYTKIFNHERVIAEMEVQPNEKNLDFVIDPFLRNLYIAVLIDNQTLRVDEISLTKFTQIIVNRLLIKKLDRVIKPVKSFMTIKFVFMVLEDNSYVQVNLSNNFPQDNTLPTKQNFALESDLFKLNIADKMILFSLKGKDKTIQVSNLLKCSWTPFTVEKDSNEETYHWDIVENMRESNLYLIRKKNANTLIVYSVNLREDVYKVNQIAKFNINNEVISVKSFYVNPHQQDIYLVVTNEDRIYTFDKSKSDPIDVQDQTLANISFIELVGYHSELIKGDDKIKYHNNLESVMNQKEISNIFSNIFHMLINDISEIYSRIKNNILNLFNKSANISSGASMLFKHYLIIFTKGSNELSIVKVTDQSVIYKKQFKNREVVKVVRNTEEDLNMGDNKFVFVVMKDKISKNFNVLKFDLENAQVSEDSSLIQDLVFEDEIQTQAYNLIKSPESSPLTLSGKFQNALLDKYDNKYLAEFVGKKIYGIKFKKENGKLSLNLAWNFLLSSGYMLVERKSPNIHKNLAATYHVMGKVFYKYIDGNMLLVLSQMENKTLMITLIKANTGKVLHQSYVSNVDFSQQILSVFEENLVVVSYIKKEKGFTRNELFSIEMMKREIDHSLTQMLEKNFKGEGEEKENVYENDLVFLTQTFVLTRRIKELSISKTKLNISNKYLIFLLENNQVFLLDKRGVSPRRPLVKEDKKGTPPVFDPLNSPYVDPEMTAYNPIINFDYKYTLNMNFIHDQIDSVLVSPTQYESTFILCTEGLNLSCYSVFPDKTFDTLSTSFAYPLIATFVIGIITLAYLLRRYVKKNEFRQRFLNTGTS